MIYLSTIYRADLENNKTFVLGGHEKAIKCVEYSSTTSTVITGSWDCTVKV